MKNRQCLLCKKEIECTLSICPHCNKGVFVVDFGDDAAKLIRERLFDKPNVYQICGWHDIFVPDGTRPPKPPREWRCDQYEPVSYHGD